MLCHATYSDIRYTQGPHAHSIETAADNTDGQLGTVGSATVMWDKLKNYADTRMLAVGDKVVRTLTVKWPLICRSEDNLGSVEMHGAHCFRASPHWHYIHVQLVRLLMQNDHHM